MVNQMEVLVEQINKGHYESNRVPIKKYYINEDPTKEESIHCPQCFQRNRHHMVRYLYLNLKEAIYKCEASDCMYPFRNFKFKNYDDNTVYQYQPLSLDTTLDHLFGYDYSNCSTQERSTYEPPVEHIASVDFDLDFLSSGSVSQKQSLLSENSSQSIQQLLNFDNFSKSFDTKFIDDILTDLLPSKPDRLDPSQCSESRIIPPESQCQEKDTLKNEELHTLKRNASGRKLEKCLKAFQIPSTVGNDLIFKKPTMPKSNVQPYKVENLSPTRLRIKKVPLHRGLQTKNPRENERCDNGRTKGIKKTHAQVKKKAIKPLEFLHTLNTLSERKVVADLELLKSKKSSNPTNVQKMLSFIKRSMKNRDHKDKYFSETSAVLSSPKCESNGITSAFNIDSQNHSPYVAKPVVEAKTPKE